MVAGFLGLGSAYVHGLSLSAICLCHCRCWVGRNVVGVSLWWCICCLSRWYWSSSVESIFPRLFFFKWYVTQPLFHLVVIFQQGYPSSVQLCSYLISHLAFEEVNGWYLAVAALSLNLVKYSVRVSFPCRSCWSSLVALTFRLGSLKAVRRSLRNFP